MTAAKLPRQAKKGIHQKPSPKRELPRNYMRGNVANITLKPVRRSNTE